MAPVTPEKQELAEPQRAARQPPTQGLDGRLATLEARLADAVNSVSEVFLLWDAEDRLILANRRFRSLYRQVSRKIRRGQSFLRFLDIIAAAEDPGEDPLSWRRKRLTLHRNGGTGEFRLADGRWLQITERPTAEGGRVMVGTEVTGFKQREETEAAIRRQIERQAANSRALVRKLNDAREKEHAARLEAERANLAKSEFLAAMSHEIRTPLNAILGFAEVIGMEIFGPAGHPKYADYANDIHRAGQHLLELIDDVLDVAKIEAGKLELDLQPLDAREIATRCRTLIADRAARKGLGLSTRLPPSLPVRADRRALRQILFNLLSNAVKFTPEGGRVTLGGRLEDEAVVIQVRDTGCGIPEEEIERLMRPFERAEKGYASPEQGTGLGLPLARSLTEMHGGSLHLMANPGGGLLAELRLPRLMEGTAFTSS